ncbi:MAG TPA: PQQ-binding-like beta-propeller repeat protein [Planctomycetota bacterium]|nr:PQQ-binding-like beta-propeller repeat protein [Planctomycetota bacterium]
MSRLSVSLACLLALTPAARAADWPAWRADAGRTAETAEKLPERLELRWSRRLPPLEPAWPDDIRLQFDAGYQPVLAGGLVLAASSREDALLAFDAATGEERWRFVADGPVRFAPYCWKGRAYLAADDGWLYCIALENGRLLWKRPGSPEPGRRVIGNGRLISVWPVRGAPVVADGKVYFAAGIWPFMGVFVHALDAETGEPVWTNSGCGAIFMPQPHYSPAFGGLAPQGYLAVNGDRLLVPNGRAVPACLRRSDGRLLYYRLANNGQNGNFFLATRGPLFFGSHGRFQLSDGANLGMLLTRPVLAEGAFYDGEPTPPPKPGATPAGPQPQRWAAGKAGDYRRFTLRGDDAPRMLLKAGDRLVAADDGRVAILRVPGADGEAPVRMWEAGMPGQPCAALFAGGRLVVATLAGEIRCYAAPEAGAAAAREHPLPPAAVAGGEPRAGRILEAAGRPEGWALVLGARSADLAAALAAAGGGRLQVVALAASEADLAAVRVGLARAGLPAARAAALQGRVGSAGLPPCAFSLVAVDDPEAAGCGGGAGFLREAFRVLRPYGGTLACPEDRFAALEAAAAEAGLDGAELRRAGGLGLVVRARAPAGSGQWTHQYANAGNTVASEERLVRAPLGLLWYGGPSADKVLPRHGQGPIPQVAGGRLVIEGPDMLRALDVYTGRLLWEAELPGVGKVFDVSSHQPGANATGSNYVTLPDAVYVLHGAKCLRLDAATGKTAAEFAVPPAPGAAAAAEASWSWLAVRGRVLLAGVSPQEFYDPDFSPEELMRFIGETEALERILKWLGGVRGFELRPKADGERSSAHVVRNLNLLLRSRDLPGRLPGKPPENAGALAARIGVLLKSRPNLADDDPELRELNRALLAMSCADVPGKERQPPGARMTWNGVSSSRLVAMDRTTGKVLWQLTARQGFVHNAVAMGGGQVYCVDRLPEHVLRWMKFNGRPVAGPPRLLALDAETGREAWSIVGDEAFAPWLGYSAEHDLLVQAARPSRDSLPEYEKRMAVHRAADGKQLWKRELDYRGPPMLIGGRIHTQELALDLLTGRAVERPAPLSGESVEWRLSRLYGCGSLLGCPTLLAFRSGTAGYWDLLRDAGTANLGGFKPGCTNSLIPADGVLAAPDYTRTCRCSFPVQCSVALVHDPSVEEWTFQGATWSGKPVRRAGINFGAPGDRLAPDGTLWIEWPSLGHISPDLPVECSPVRAPDPEVLPVFMPPPPKPGEPAQEVKPVPGPETFRMHSLEISGDGLRWVAASGLRGVERLAVDLGKGPARRYTVRLHFCEPDRLGPGARVFDVRVQGKAALRNLDIAAEAGGARRPLVREVQGVEVAERLELTFHPARGSAAAVISGLEVRLEE